MNHILIKALSLIIFLTLKAQVAEGVGAEILDLFKHKPGDRDKKGAGSGPTTFCYEYDGCKQGDPNSDWEKGACKDGNRQSPIDLDTSLSLPTEPGQVADTTLDLSGFVDNYRLGKYKLHNKGFSVYVNPDPDGSPVPEFQWKERGASYRLGQIHFHWGANDQDGSEHAFSGKKYPLEMHLVHASTEHGTAANALASKDPQGLAVIGFVFEVKDDADDSFLKPIVSQLLSGDLTEYDKEIESGAEIDFRPLLKSQTEAYTYDGSLTTPAGEFSCAEQVAWIVCKNSVPVRKEDLEAFRKAMNKVSMDGTDTLHPAMITFRHLQPLNGRSVRVIKINASGA